MHNIEILQKIQQTSNITQKKQTHKYTEKNSGNWERGEQYREWENGRYKLLGIR